MFTKFKFEMDLETIKFCTNKEYLDKLLEDHNQFTTARCEHAEKIRTLQQQNEELRRRLCTLIETKGKLRIENLTLLKKLENIRQREEFKDETKYFNVLSELLGYSISDDITFNNELRIQYIKCHYNKEYYAGFEISTAGIINLREIVPEHPNIERIKEHLWNTQDSVSLLSNLRKYFSAMESRETLTYQN